MRQAISQVIKKISEAKTFNERVELMRRHDDVPLRVILKLMYDKYITWNLSQGTVVTSTKWLLPDGRPPYKPNEFMNQQGAFYKELRKLYLFLEGGNPNLAKLQRESLYISFLESLERDDAELLLDIKDKKYPKNITLNLVNTAFPGLIQTEEEVKKES